MLQKLYIQNYAIIDELEINFSSSLNIITGETGAGKSILMGALSLILGERADSSILQNKEKKAVVEGEFKVKEEQVAQFLQENSLDVEDIVVIRREIAVNGKSRAFINDTPVNLSQLKSLGILLVDLHQQFDVLELNTSNFQQHVLDALANNSSLLQQYKELFSQYIQTKKELQELQAQQSEINATLEYNQFLFNELEEIALKENELENLDAELELLNNAESIKQQLSGIYFELKEREQPVIQQLKILSQRLYSLQQYNVGVTALAERLQSTQIELEDAADEIDHINETIVYDAERIQYINDRISAGYKLQKKHGVISTNELLSIKEKLQQKLLDVRNVDTVSREKEVLTQQLSDQCKKLAETISDRRKKIIHSFEENVHRLLVQVGMPNAYCIVELQPMDELSENGMDKIEFLFDANRPAGKIQINKRLEPLRKIASGGELSRLMLCIKSLVATHLQLPTLIFDEIDTGISGEAAKQVGHIMKDLSSLHQLIAITHQPQIAARADAHYFVYKTVHTNKVTTAVKLLNTEERILAIAQMLSGVKPTTAALQNAREMVSY